MYLGIGCLIYDICMTYKRTGEPPGPKSVFNRSLGIVVNGVKFPARINEMLREREVKRMLNWMVMDEGFKTKMLEQVPENDPPEP